MPEDTQDKNKPTNTSSNPGRALKGRIQKNIFGELAKKESPISDADKKKLEQAIQEHNLAVKELADQNKRAYDNDATNDPKEVEHIREEKEKRHAQDFIEPVKQALKKREIITQKLKKAERTDKHTSDEAFTENLRENYDKANEQRFEEEAKKNTEKMHRSTSKPSNEV